MFTIKASCGTLRSLVCMFPTIENIREEAKTIVRTELFTVVQVFDEDGVSLGRWQYEIGWLQEGDVEGREVDYLYNLADGCGGCGQCFDCNIGGCEACYLGVPEVCGHTA